MNFWDYHISNHKSYIRSYGEGEGSPNRKTLFKYINKGDSVLHVGCGPGCNYGHDRDYENKISKYKGVDISEKFIEACRELFQEAEWEVQDANYLAEFDNSWDVVILQDVLEHLPSYAFAIWEAARVARKRVIICLWVPLIDGEDRIEDKGDGGYHSEYNKDKFLDLISELGEVVYDEQHENRSHWYYIINL